MKQPSNCKVKDCEIRNIINSKNLWPQGPIIVKFLLAIWDRKDDTTEKKNTSF